MSDFTPTTEQVRNAYVAYEWNSNGKSEPVAHAEFDRWLEEVKEEAWDAGNDIGYLNGAGACNC